MPGRLVGLFVGLGGLVGLLVVLVGRDGMGAGGGVSGAETVVVAVGGKKMGGLVLGAVEIVVSGDDPSAVGNPVAIDPSSSPPPIDVNPD